MARPAVTVRKWIPHNHVDLPPLVSVQATGVCIPIGNTEVLLAAVSVETAGVCMPIGNTEVLLASVYKSPGRPGVMKTSLSS
jgi:hypothetical protein